MRVEGVFRDAKETKSVPAGTVVFKVLMGLAATW